MNEQTALFLGRLSHQWSPVVWSLPLVFGVATYGTRVLNARIRAGGNAFTRRIGKFVQVTSGTLLVMSLLILGVSLMHLGCATQKAHSTQCMSNLKRLAIGIMLYAQDYDERLPPATRWAEAIDSHVRGSIRSNTASGDDPFRCPSAVSPASYGMNAALSGLSLSNLDDLANTALLFDADAPRRSFAGGPGDVAQKRHNGAPTVLYADGHTRYANPYVLGKLNWIPKKTTVQRQPGP